VIYWDTSCVLKLYAAESDSAEWEAIALNATRSFCASSLLGLEMACALEQKELRGDIKAGAATLLLEMFHRDVAMGRFALYPVGADVLERARHIAATCYRHETPIHLRTLDAIHLATADAAGCHQLATADKRMREALPLLGLSPLT
jgi:predicted nucleic acid-binding protein